MKIFVISLKESVERRERISRILNGMEIQYEIFDAVNGREGLPQELASKPDDQHRRIFRSRPLSAGEKGCYASHYRLWQKCIDLNQPILIIEDDCHPTQHIKSSIKTLELMFTKGYEYIRVEPQDGQVTFLEEINGSQSVYWHNNLSGTRGYSISPRGAKKLLDKSDKWLCAVDNFIGESYRTKLKCTGIVPYLVVNPSDMATTIQNGGPTLKTPVYFKLTRELYRFYRFIRLSLWNVKNKTQ